jgi:hypothetical protein
MPWCDPVAGPWIELVPKDVKEPARAGHDRSDVRIRRKVQHKFLPRRGTFIVVVHHFLISKSGIGSGVKAINGKDGHPIWRFLQLNGIF